MKRKYIIPSIVISHFNDENICVTDSKVLTVQAYGMQNFTTTLQTTMKIKQGQYSIEDILKYQYDN